MSARKPIRVLVLIWVAAILAAYVVPFTAVAQPTITVDENGANDEPGQKDLTLQFFEAVSGGFNLGWNWDDISWSGSNTGDACALFDSDNDGNANYSLCVEVSGTPTATMVAGYPKLYTCADSSPVRCFGAAVVSPITSTCSVAVSTDQPFPSGTATPNDLKATCNVKASEVGGASTDFINSCSYPSHTPNSDFNDCILIPRDAFVTIIKQANPSDSTQFPFTLKVGTNTPQAFGTITGSGTFGPEPVPSQVQITIAEQVPNGWTLNSISCTRNGSPIGTVAKPGVTMTLASKDQVTCTFVDTKDQPSLLIEKSAAEASYDHVGQVLHYSYKVTNNGNVGLAGPVTVSDDIANDENCPAVSGQGNGDNILDPGEFITCTATYTITQADLDRGFVKNVATATAGGTTSPPDDVTVPADQKPSLLLEKSAAETSYDHVGQVLHYSYKVTNNGNVRVLGPVTVSDDIASDESCPPVSGQGNGDAYLDPGESITCTATYTITQADLDRGFVKNVATATAGGTTSPPDDVTVPADLKPALTIEKSATETSYDHVGQVLHYFYKVTNTGNVRLAGPVTVSDDIAADESCPDVASQGNGDSFLDVGESITCTATYTITPEDLDRGFVKNVATASVPGGTTSPPDDVTVPADQNPSLLIEKSATETSYDHLGQVIHYFYKVTNNGNVGLAGPVTVSDDIAADETCPPLSTIGDGDNILDPNESVTCTATYTITQEDLDRGFVKNVATASVPGGTTSPPDDVTIPADQNPEITVVKSGLLDKGDDNVANPGDEVTYSYTITNTGNVGLTNVTLDDDKTTDETCDAVSSQGDLDNVLDPGESITCSSHYQISQSDLDAGSVTNIATATGTPPQGTPVTDTDTFTLPLPQGPDMSVGKGLTSNADQDGSNSITEGDDITYTITITNTGNVTLTGVTVNDPIPDQTTYVSCGPVGTCTPNGNPVTSVTWTIDPIAPGGSASVTLTVKVGAITACRICNIASATSTQTTGSFSNPELCVTPVPIGHPDAAKASGSAIAAKVRVDLLGIDTTIAPVSSSQSGLGHNGDEDSVLTLAVPPPAGTIAKAGLLTTTTSSDVTASPERAMNTSTAETLGVNLLNGTITADLVRGVAHTEAWGSGAFPSAAGSTFVNLKVSGLARANVAPNTKIKLPAALFGSGSFIILYERIGGTSGPAAGQLSGGTYAADLTVNMIHVFVKDALPIVPGNQTTEIIVSGATSHSDFPQTTVCAPGQAPREVSGHAFIAQAVVTTNDPVDPELLSVIEGFVGIPATGGTDHQELPSVVITEPDGSVLQTEDVSSNSFGTISDPNGVAASSYAQAANVCLLNTPTGCTVRVTLVKSQSNSFGPQSGTQAAKSDTTGTQLVGLEIAGNPVNITPDPNTVINIPGVGFIVLNEQFCDGAGALPDCTTEGGRHAGLTVRSLRLVVTALDPLGVGVSVIVAEAHSDVTRPPLTLTLPGTGI